MRICSSSGTWAKPLSLNKSANSFFAYWNASGGGIVDDNILCFVINHGSELLQIWGHSWLEDHLVILWDSHVDWYQRT